MGRPTRSAAAFLLLGAASTSADPCNLSCPPCQSSCLAPCTIPIAIRSTGTCPGGSIAFPDPVATLPGARFWKLDHYVFANSGCDPVLAALGPSAARIASDWSNPAVDGCVRSSGGPDRTVVETSYADPAREGTENHRALYLVASVDETAGYDFDRVRGGSPCDPALTVSPVGGVTIDGRAIPCRGSLTPTLWFWDMRANANDCMYTDVYLTLTDPSPLWYTEAGARGAPDLVAGYQIVFTAPATNQEPTTSRSCSGVWQPARDPGDPRLVHAVVPLGTTRVTVAVPSAWTRTWLATRLVYLDASLNPLAAYDPALSPGPRVLSEVSEHCGPIQLLQTFDIPLNLTKDDGVPESSAALPGDPLTYTFRTSVSGSMTDGRQVVLRDVFPACLDLTGFDPATNPAQVQVNPGPANAAYDAPSRTLTVSFLGNTNLVDQTVTVLGIRAGGPSTCCNRAEMQNCRLTVSSYDSETFTDTCTRIVGGPGCPSLPVPVTGLRAAKRFDDVDLSWAASGDPATDRYNVWKVTSGFKTRIPLANEGVSLRSSDIALVARDVAKTVRAGSDRGVVSPGPALLFYQVRGVCIDGTEGTEHP